MNPTFLSRKYRLAIVSFACLLYACTKIESTTIGGELIPPIDGVNTKDTFLTVITDIFPEKDTFRVPKNQDHVLGYISAIPGTGDQLFGSTQAAINFQVTPQFTPFFYEVRKDSLYLDSAVLVLNYRGAWGDTTSTLNIRVFEIDPAAQMKSDSAYSNVVEFPKAALIGSRDNIDPKLLDDSVHAFKENAKNQLRIPLTSSFGTKLLNDFDSTNAFKSDSLFKTYFGGLTVEAQTLGNVLLKFNLQDVDTKIALYYKYDKRGGGGRDTTVRYFHFNPITCASSNYIKRDRSTAEVVTYLANATPDSLLHLQAAPGTYARILIPGLDSLSNRIVHRAELLMEQVSDQTLNSDRHYTPPALFLTAFSDDSARRFAVPYDVELTPSGVSNFLIFGGIPFKKTDANNTSVTAYNFTLTRYVQSIVTRKEKNYKLALFAPYIDFINPVEKTEVIVPVSSTPVNDPGIGRVRLGGGNHSQRPMKLRIIYSELK